ncbi:hypothetical protein HHK36_001919 [Tetracentron sinense]|uniref:TIR domain-containing protein n=2 Tax=Tetracentron sinense TaxID=13715 RepID=A0A835DRJ0_TETSI|nr:hypothetical protein HHK36_001919 [Tetracentron sinense]
MPVNYKVGFLYNQPHQASGSSFSGQQEALSLVISFREIDSAIRNCKVGVAVFSPHYCESYFCLHELALIMETKRKVIPIFCDVKPSELRVMDYGICPAKDLQRFSWALEEAKHTVGLTFDSLTGDWSDLVATASDSVIRNLIEVEEDSDIGANNITDWSDLVATASDSVIRNLIEVEEEQRYRYYSISSDDSEKDLAAVKRGLISAYKSNLADKLKDELQKISNDLEAGPEDKQFGRWCTTWWQQFSVLLRRGLKERKHESFSGLKIGQVMVVAFLAGLLRWQSGLAHLQAQIGLLFFYSGFWGFFPLFQAIFTFPQEGFMLMKERSSCMYGLSSYFMARTVGDLPMELVLPTIFVTITYWMGGLRPTAGNYFHTLAVLLYSVLVAQGLGLALGAIVMDLKFSTTLGSVIMLSFLLAGAMNRSPAKNVGRLILDYRSRTQTVNRPCDVFINHRGVDTKRSVAGLLYNHLTRLRLHPFLDSKSMKPGDKLFEKIDSAIRNCKVGVAVFSPHYCESYFCLHELALIMETKRKVIPIFCDVKPSELRVMDYGICPAKDLQRFSWALEEAKHTVGLTFDSLTGDWSDLVATASDSVIRNLIEVEEEQRYRCK